MFISRTPSRILSRTYPFSRPILFRYDPNIFQTFHEGEGTGGGGGTPPAPKPTKEEIDAAVKNRITELLGKSNDDPETAMAKLIRSEHTQRLRAEKAEGDLNALKVKVPDDATSKLLEDYKALGSLDDVRKVIDDGKSAVEKLQGIEKQAKLSTVADVLKLKQGPLFNTLLGSAEFEIEGEGDARKVLVKSGDKKLSFEDYAKERPELQEGLAALQLKPEDTKPVPPETNSQDRGAGGAAALDNTPEAKAASRGMVNAF